jgi:glycogen debranching enzyme
MAIAPELFTPARAKRCLQIVEQVLMSPTAMGIKTLDPSDRNYNGNYVNSDATNGHNYHQGPEWLWPVGYFLQAKLAFCEYQTIEEA